MLSSSNIKTIKNSYHHIQFNIHTSTFNFLSKLYMGRFYVSYVYQFVAFWFLRIMIFVMKGKQGINQGCKKNTKPFKSWCYGSTREETQGIKPPKASKQSPMRTKFSHEHVQLIIKDQRTKFWWWWWCCCHIMKRERKENFIFRSWCILGTK